MSNKRKLENMKRLLDWQSEEVVSIYDEVNLWSAPFGRMLLENIPMKRGIRILDIGFGTGFPLIELSQRFGLSSKVYGIDIWEGGIKRAKEKIRILDLKNIKILEGSGSNIRIGDNEIDLVTSNLGINNFEERELVYKEIYRILHREGRLSITTNPIGTFEELFVEFEIALKELDLKEELVKFKDYIKHRKTEDLIIEEFKEIGFELVKRKSDETVLRFVSGEALFNHVLIRMGFRESWEKMLKEEARGNFFRLLIQRLEEIIKKEGEFKMRIPMLYLEFKKK